MRIVHEIPRACPITIFGLRDHAELTATTLPPVDSPLRATPAILEEVLG